MSDEQSQPVGFIGLGTMGEPMALNLRRAGIPLVVWNRTRAKADVLAAAGADVAASVDEVFQRTRTIIVMLTTAAVLDEVLGRTTPGFAARVRGATIVQMGTIPAMSSLTLAREIEAAGGDYVEAPVSGQRKPAQAGQLVAMLAGRADVIERVRPLLTPMCRETIICGPVPQALALKVASNHFVATMLVALAETVHFARREGVDLELFSSLMSVGPMASDLLRMKLPKLIAGDFATQASLQNMSDQVDILRQSARQSGAATPVLDACEVLCREAVHLGLRDADAVSVIQALEKRAAPSAP